MTPRQTATHQWLIVQTANFTAVRRLPRGSGVILLARLTPTEHRLLRRLARSRGLVVVAAGRRHNARVHNVRELTLALLHRSPMILLSPVYPTASHPEWEPLPRMRAAALARLAKRRAIALGGMNLSRFERIAPLGFTGWAGISAFRT